MRISPLTSTPWLGVFALFGFALFSFGIGSHSRAVDATPLERIQTEEALKEFFGTYTEAYFQGHCSSLSSGTKQNFNLAILRVSYGPIDRFVKEVYGVPHLQPLIAFLKWDESEKTGSEAQNPPSVLSLLGEETENGISLRSDSLSDFDHLRKNTSDLSRYVRPSLEIQQVDGPRIQIFGLEEKENEKCSIEPSKLPTLRLRTKSPMTGVLVSGEEPDQDFFDVWLQTFVAEDQVEAGVLSIGFQFRRWPIVNGKISLGGYRNLVGLVHDMEAKEMAFSRQSLEGENRDELWKLTEEYLGKDFIESARHSNLPIGKALIKFGEETFGTWGNAVSGTCHMPKTIHTTIKRAMPIDTKNTFYGYQYDPGQKIVHRPLRFEWTAKPEDAPCSSEKVCSIKMEPGTPGWPASIDLRSVQAAPKPEK